MQSPPVKVSVCMIAYNQEAFIAQAIDSILAQETNFDFELIIGDDNSKDATKAICESYAAKFPGRIKYIRREKNMGMMPNFIDILEQSTGQYVAICEGDDYWTDENKLQLQADFLDANPDHSLCCHNHYVLTNDKLIERNKDITGDKKHLTAEDYMRRPFFHTTSYFFRNDAQPRPYPAWYKDVLAGDHFLVLFIAMKGFIGYIDRRMSVFRNHGSSVSFTRRPLDIKKNFVQHLKIFDEYSEKKFHRSIQKVIDRWNLVYKVYEPVSYFGKLGYFIKNTGVYLGNFSRVGGIKLFLKYLLPNQLVRKVKNQPGTN